MPHMAWHRTIAPSTPLSDLFCTIRECPPASAVADGRCLRVTGRSTRHDPLPPSTRANRARMEPLPAQSIMPPKAVRLTVPSPFGFLAAIG